MNAWSAAVAQVPDLALSPVPEDEPFGRLQPVDLRTATTAADLLDRYDRKYLLGVAELPRVIAGLRDVHRLVVGGSDRIGYTTTYFDHPGLHTYRAHLQGRRRRYKIRIRTYAGGPTMMEVKFKSRGGRTEKRRIPHAPTHDRLSEVAAEFAAVQVREAYGVELPSPLVPTVTTHFQRTTVVDLVAGERLTFDFGLCLTTGGVAASCRPDVVTAELKSPVRHGPTHRLLRELGVRSAKVSKYAVGVAVHYPGVPANPWHPALRQLHPGTAESRRPGRSGLVVPVGADGGHHPR